MSKISLRLLKAVVYISGLFYAYISGYRSAFIFFEMHRLKRMESGQVFLIVNPWPSETSILLWKNHLTIWETTNHSLPLVVSKACFRKPTYNRLEKEPWFNSYLQKFFFEAARSSGLDDTKWKPRFWRWISTFRKFEKRFRRWFSFIADIQIFESNLLTNKIYVKGFLNSHLRLVGREIHNIYQNICFCDSTTNSSSLEFWDDMTSAKRKSTVSSIERE